MNHKQSTGNNPSIADALVAAKRRARFYAFARSPPILAACVAATAACVAVIVRQENAGLQAKASA